MPSFFGASPTISVHLHEPTVYLRPSPDPSIPSDDPLLRGTVTLTLPKPRAVSEFIVKLNGTISYKGGPDFPYEELDDVLTKDLCLGLNGEVLPAGDHKLDFSFIIPANTAEYQRSSFGRVYHQVSATCRLDGNAKVKSAHVPAYLVTNPALIPGQSLDAFNDMLITYHENLGPIRVTISAPQLTVASLILFEIFLLSPPAGITIKNLKGFIKQEVAIQYKNSEIAQSQPAVHILFDLDQAKIAKVNEKREKEKLATANQTCKTKYKAVQQMSVGGADAWDEVKEGVEWAYRKLSRLPHDDKIRPSTLEHTITPIRVQHMLGVEIKYRIAGAAQDEVIQLAKKAHVASCCCFLDDLPSYAEAKAMDESCSKSAPDCSKCVCHSTEQELIEKEEQGSFNAPMLSSRAHLGQEDPRSKTPAVGRVDFGARRREVF
ncbi:hypothetical protein T439DRAFT_328334 [Meredithblackwellia eburnea MCA 4105]